MKVTLSDVKPNPFRDIQNYPIDRARVDKLKASIGSTDFWDNILARQKDGKFQIAYGHHRLRALLEIYGPDHEIDITVRNLSDEQMLRIMAEENITISEHDPKVMIETIRQTIAYLEAHPEVREKLDESGRKGPVAGNRTVGKVLISKFLGGNWTEGRVAEILAVIDGADPEVIAKAPSLRHMAEIARVKDKNIQRKVLGTAVNGKTVNGKKRKCTALDIRKMVEPHVSKSNGASPNGPHKKDVFIQACAKVSAYVASALALLEGDVKKGWPEADERNKKLIREVLLDFRNRTQALVTVVASPVAATNNMRRVANG